MTKKSLDSVKKRAVFDIVQCLRKRMVTQNFRIRIYPFQFSYTIFPFMSPFPPPRSFFGGKMEAAFAGGDTSFFTRCCGLFFSILEEGEGRRGVILWPESNFRVVGRRRERERRKRRRLHSLLFPAKRTPRLFPPPPPYPISGDRGL